MRHRPRAAIAAWCLASALAAGCSRSARPGADLVITHAKIWTGDPLQPEAAAIAVIGDRIVDVGSADAIERWRGRSTTVVDAEGRRLIPGFNDAHVHFVRGGTDLERVDLGDAASQAELARRIAERARAKPGEWVLGGGWDEHAWTPAELPTRHLIDDATNGTPVYVTSHGDRMALVNSAALGRAGITERTPDPPGGTIVRDARGFPTGVLEDAAADLVARVVPRMTPGERVQAVKRALQHAATLGVTSVQDMDVSSDDVAVYADLANRGELTVRVYAASSDAGWYDQARLGLRRAFGSPSLRLGAVSGSIGDTPVDENRRTRLMAADHAGLQVCMEVRSAEGASAALDLVEEFVRADGDRDRRFRVEHADRAAARDVGRFATLKAIASVAAAPPAAFEWFSAGGVRLAMGSGWPEAPLNPLLRVSAAAAHATVAAALAASTSGPAFAEFQDGVKGTITRGKLADIVILSDDIFSIPAAQIKDVNVLTTIVGGTIVHQRNP
jgi:predicted amidohydrolase YtcJ